jgi:hypothetical protein
VLALVRSGRLRAIDIGTGRRGHYVVPVEWLEEYERERTTRAPATRKRRRALPAQVTEYIH